MKEKIKTICLILITISVIAFSIAYTFRTLVDYGCSSPKLYSIKDSGTIGEKVGSTSFLGTRCILWQKLIQLQVQSVLN